MALGINYPSIRDIESRLAGRRALEDPRRPGPRARSLRKDRLEEHRHAIGALIRMTLRLTGLYRRGLANAMQPVIREVRCPLRGLPRALDGFRILQLADLHIDGWEGHPARLAKMIAGIPADLCVLSGDYRFDLEGDCGPVCTAMEEMLAAVRTPHGIYGILGNHDSSEIAVELERMGVRMLINESARIHVAGGDLWLIGVDDPYYYGCDDLPLALDGVPGSDIKVLLAHSPELCKEAAAAGIDLYLCGHTHGGQICLPGGVLVRHVSDSPRRYAKGAWIHDGMPGYTSAGIGCSTVRVRYNCPPEIVVLTLTAAG